MEHLVVSSGLLVISPGPYFCFASVNALSTAIRSVLSLYSAFWSVPAFFFGLPRVGLLTGTLFTLHQIQVIFSGILVVIECQNHLVDFAKNIICQALSELYKKRWHERGGGPSGIPQPDKVLEIRILHEFLNQLPVRETELFLDQKGTRSHTERFCRHIGLTWKELRIFLFYGIPRNGFGLLDPAVFRIHF